MAAEAGVERGTIRLYHQFTLIMKMSHSLHSQLLPSSMLFRLQSLKTLRYMFVFEVYILTNRGLILNHDTIVRSTV